MKYYIMLYYLVEDYIARRAPLRDEHLRLARQRGELILAGALSEPADRALLVFRVLDRSVIEEFAKKDPYVINGLVARWEIRPWTVVIGSTNE